MSKQNKNKENAAFFRERAKELRTLREILSKQFSGEQTNLDSLIVAAKDLEKKAEEGILLDTWGYTIKDLILPLGDIRDVNPAGIQARVCLSCTCEFNVKDWNNTSCDPFNKFSFRLRIIGQLDDVVHSWGMHLDKETRSDLDEWHPMYHMHCFESRVDSPVVLIDSPKKKGSFLLNVPRFVHYPLDIFLGIGFCLMNFYKKDVFLNLYYNDQQFPRLYNKSEERILKPYFASLANNPGSMLKQKLLCPQAV